MIPWFYALKYFKLKVLGRYNFVTYALWLDSVFVFSTSSFSRYLIKL